MKIRVGFATPYSKHANFVIALDESRFTENQMAASLKVGVLYEQLTSWVMIGLLRPGDSAVDIGAHVGYYTLLMRTLVGDTGQVYAAEPMPQSYASLQENIALNQFHNVYAVPQAISNHVGQQLFKIDSRNEGESHLVGNNRGGADAGETIVVASSTLDVWLDSIQKPPRLVKMDAEGCEDLILAGGERFFAQNAPDSVVCEINPPALSRYGSKALELRRRFRNLGYECFLINLATEGPFDLCGGAFLKRLGDYEEINVNVVYNLLFTRPDVRPLGLGV